MNPAVKDRLTHELIRLQELSPRLGLVTAVDPTTLHVEFTPTPDLDLLTEHAQFEVTIPQQWPARPPRAVFRKGKPPVGEAWAPGQTPKTVLLDDEDGWSRTYELAVVFFTLRDLFKRRGVFDTPW